MTTGRINQVCTSPLRRQARAPPPKQRDADRPHSGCFTECCTLLQASVRHLHHSREITLRRWRAATTGTFAEAPAVPNTRPDHASLDALSLTSQNSPSSITRCTSLAAIVLATWTAVLTSTRTRSAVVNAGTSRLSTSRGFGRKKNQPTPPCKKST